jgi:hypothetical protein
LGRFKLDQLAEAVKIDSEMLKNVKLAALLVVVVTGDADGAC